jgi:hypothetical protein
MPDPCNDYPFVAYDPRQHEGPFFVHHFKAKLWEDNQINRRGVRLGYFLRNVEGVYHALNGPLRYTTTSGGYPQDNHNHVFYLKDESIIEVINRAFGDDEKTQDTLIARLEDFNMAKGSAKAFYFLKMNIDLSAISSNTIPLYYWICDSCKGEVWRFGPTALVFENEEDLIACKLKFT